MSTLPHEAPRTPWGWNSPVFVALAPEHYRNPDNDGIGISRRWTDHQDLIERHGHTVYVAHPYVLDGEALDDLSRLRSAGWAVRVDGSEYYPGRTVRVSLESPGRRSARTSTKDCS